MATAAGPLRRKQGPVKKRLEDCLLEVRQFLLLPIPEDLDSHMFKCSSYIETLQARLEAFQEIEAQLEVLTQSSAEVDKKLSESDESYLTLPLDATEALRNLKLINRQITNAQGAPQKKEAEEKKLKLELELERERGAWKIQLEELQHKEQQSLQARKQEYLLEQERRKQEQDAEIQKYRLELERLRI